MMTTIKMTDKQESCFTSLAGQVLIATPNIDDDRFERAVIYLSAHTADTGAMGIIINRSMPTMSFYEILEQLNIPIKHLKEIPMILVGGPTQLSRGFILHSGEYHSNLSLSVHNDIALTASQDILRDMAEGHGPKDCLVALGCATWQAGQLEEELMGNIWLTAPATTELLFHTPFDKRWDKALSSIGVESNLLSSEFGKA